MGCARAGEGRDIPLGLESRLFRKLQMIDDATTGQDLRAPASNHFKELRGNLAGFHAIRGNSPWRLMFQWDGSGGEVEGVYELCNDRRHVRAATALILARVFGNSPDFWRNVQRRNDLWEAMNSPRERERIERATPLGAAV